MAQLGAGQRGNHQVKSLSEILQAQHDIDRIPSSGEVSKDRSHEQRISETGYGQEGSNTTGTTYRQPVLSDSNQETSYYEDGPLMIQAAFAAQAMEMTEMDPVDADMGGQSVGDESEAAGALRSSQRDPCSPHNENHDDQFLQYDSSTTTTANLSGSKKRKMSEELSTGAHKYRNISTYPRRCSQFPILPDSMNTSLEEQHSSERPPPAYNNPISQSSREIVMPVDHPQADASHHDLKCYPPANIAIRKKSHISAEQKRRAAIKSGYEALYRVIPALRDAGLSEGKGRGGSGPGGGGALERGRENHSPTQASPFHDIDGEDSSTPVTPMSSGKDKPSRRQASIKADVHAQHEASDWRNYPRGQQFDEVGRPIRPGVRSVFPLVRQPGSEISDGRQGPRSESVVLQKTVHYLRREQAIRSHSIQRLKSLRYLATQVFPDHDHSHLGLGPRLVEADLDPFTFPSMNHDDAQGLGPSLQAYGYAHRQSLYDNANGDEGGQTKGSDKRSMTEIFNDASVEQEHLDPLHQEVRSPSYDAHTRGHDRLSSTLATVLATTPGGALFDQRSIAAQRVNQGDGGHPKQSDEMSRQRVLVDWEGEWEGAAFLGTEEPD